MARVMGGAIVDGPELHAPTVGAFRENARKRLYIFRYTPTTTPMICVSRNSSRLT